MKRMKTFWKYFLMFLGLFLLVTVLTEIGTNSFTRDIRDYEVIIDSPKIEIMECKAGYTKGGIKGKITNNTGALINKTYIKVQFYNSKEESVGSAYEEVRLLNVGETQNFDIQYRCQNFNKMRISVVDEKPETR